MNVRCLALMLLILVLASCSKEESLTSFEMRIARSELKAVHIDRARGKPYSIDMRPAATAKSGQPLDSERQAELFQAVETLTFSGGFEAEPGSLEKYGLSDPALTVGLDLVGRPDITVYFGNYQTFVLKRYAQLTSRTKVFLVPEAFYDSFNKEERYFVDPVLVRLSIPDTCGLSIEGPNIDLVFKRDAAGWVQQIDGQVLAADADAVHAVLANIQFLRSRNVVAHSESQKPRHQITISNCSEEHTILSVTHMRRDAFDIEGDPMLVGVSSMPGLVFEIERKDAPVIIPAPTAFRRVRPFQLPVAQVYEAQFLNLDSPRVFLRSDTGWSVNRQPGDGPFIEDVLKSFAELRVERYVDTDAAHLALTETRPFLGVLFRNQAGENMLEASIWRDETTGKFYGWNNHFQELFELPRSSIPRIFPRLEVLIPAQSG